MVVYCSVYQCKSSGYKNEEYDPDTTYHRFPKVPEKLDLWIRAMNLATNWMPGPSHRICSKHFEPHFFYVTEFGQKRLLHEAVPTIFPASAEYNMQPNKTLKRKQAQSDLEAELGPSTSSSQPQAANLEEESLRRQQDPALSKNGKEVDLPRRHPKLKKVTNLEVTYQESGMMELKTPKVELTPDEWTAASFQPKKLFINLTRFDDPSRAYSSVIKKEKTSQEVKLKTEPDDHDQLDTHIDIKQSLTSPSLLSVQNNYKPEDLIIDWKTNSSKCVLQYSMPQHWGMTVTSAGIYFNYVGESDKNETIQEEEITRSILVKFDMSVEVIVRGRTTTYPEVSPITGFSELLSAMELVMNAAICTGSDCPDVLFVPDRKSRSTMCKTCRIEERYVRERMRSKRWRAKQRLLNPPKAERLTRKRLESVEEPNKSPPVKKGLDSFWDDPNIDINTGTYDDLSDNAGVAEDSNESTSNEAPAQTDVETSQEPSTTRQREGLLELFDMVSHDTRCVVVNKDITADETDDLVKCGINVIHMSTDPNKKKRVIYIGRDVTGCNKRCDYCPITFFTVADAEDHRLAHKKGKVKLDENMVGRDIFRCSQCPAEFVVQADFKLHCYYLHQEMKPFVCTHCNKHFRNHKNLQEHTRFTVNGSRTCQLICLKCGKDFKKQDLYDEHVAVSEAAATCDIAKCKECGESMARAIFDEHLKTHTDTRTLSNAESALCPECGKFLTSTKNLQAHMRLVHSATKDGYPCKHCDRVFSQRAYVATHTNTVHGVAKLICDQCPRMFKHRQNLRHHIERHHGNKNEKGFACEKCGLLFQYGFGLRLHISNIHEGIKDHVCDLCGERFARTDYLQRHKKYHDRYMQNVCGICKASFRTPWYLRMHMDGGHDDNGRPLWKKNRVQRNPDGTKVVTKKNQKYKLTAKSMKPKACPICQKVLSNTNSLRHHYRGHLKLLQTKCPKCDIYFASESTLGKHLLRHDDPLYNLRCKVCHLLHESKEHLAQHVALKHKELKHKCHICKEGFGRKHQLANHVHVKHPEELERREQLFSMLESTEAPDVPLETYKQKRKHCRKSTFKENDIDYVANRFKVGKKEPEFSYDDHFSENDEQDEYEDEYEDKYEEMEEEPKEEPEPSEEEEEEFSLFDEDYDVTEETCRQLKEEDLENGF